MANEWPMTWNHTLCINNTRAQDWVYHVVRTTTLPTLAIGISIVAPQSPHLSDLSCGSKSSFNTRSDFVEASAGKREISYSSTIFSFYYTTRPGQVAIFMITKEYIVFSLLVGARSFDARAEQQYDGRIIYIYIYIYIYWLAAIL